MMRRIKSMMNDDIETEIRNPRLIFRLFSLMQGLHKT